MKRFESFALKYPENAEAIRKLLPELREQFTEMASGKLPVGKIGRRAKELHRQPVDADLRKAVEGVFSKHKVLQEKQEEYFNALAGVSFAGVTDATTSPIHQTFARDQIGGGRANTNDRSALRGQQARRLNDMIPAAVSPAERTSVVTELLIEIGFSDTTTANVASILEYQRRPRRHK